ncbi:SIMPL domain-containing protein [Marinospirillum minutulum]|uniref:SIMPL domain-containing protein n=1 Tax=Marinospirillum minutulum TaxID=64974 RepID=UPI0004149D34|nr:SIMPL domain-containing protein [Marinospirillum minutulum]
MKRIKFFSLILGLLAFSLSANLLAEGWAPTPHLQVVGEAKLSLDADLVDIHANFSAEHQDSQLAIQTLEQDFNLLLRNLKRQVPQGARLEAGQISIYPRRTQRNETWQITGYTASRDLKIIDLPVTQTGEWIEKITQGKPSQLGPMHYHSSQAAKSRNPALKGALKDAQEKAELMAKSLGQNLGRALQIQEITSPGVESQKMFMAADSVSRSSTPVVAPGKVEATARVRVIFELL